ncbi:MAG: type II toxin-antitoxin system YoeB family toxin [Thermodesulfobacteriota bacterium]
MRLLFRLNDEHRLVYEVTEEAVPIAQLRYHYQPTLRPITGAA